MIDQLGLLAAAQAFGADNCFELGFRFIQIIIDQDIVIAVPMAYLVPTFLHPAFNHCVVVFAAADKAAVQFSNRGWQNKNRQDAVL